jgi:hypothetical protein
MPEVVKYPIFIIPPEDDAYRLGRYLAVGEQFGLCHGFGQTKEEALADLRKNIEERAMEIRKYHGMMPTPMTPLAEVTTLEVTMPDILPD